MEPKSEQTPRKEAFKEVLVAKAKELVRREGRVSTEKPPVEFVSYTVDLKTARFSKPDSEIFSRWLGPTPLIKIMIFSRKEWINDKTAEKIKHPKETQIQVHAIFTKERHIINLSIPENKEPSMTEHQVIYSQDKTLPPHYTTPTSMKINEATFQTFIDLLDQAQLG